MTQKISAPGLQKTIRHHIWRETRENLGVPIPNGLFPNTFPSNIMSSLYCAFISKTKGEKSPFKLEPRNTVFFASANILGWAFFFF